MKKLIDKNVFLFYFWQTYCTTDPFIPQIQKSTHSSQSGGSGESLNFGYAKTWLFEAVQIFRANKIRHFMTLSQKKKYDPQAKTHIVLHKINWI